jgi:chromosome partitioning protein
MGAVQHEEEANRGAIPGCNQGAGNWAADNRDSKGCSGGGLKAVRFCDSLSVNQGGDIAGSEPGLFQSEAVASGLRRGNRSAPGASSVHCEKMGGGRQNQAGSQTMKTVVIANQKGGVGKTATVVHLAFDFLEKGCRVAVVDLDTQGNASYSLQQHDSGYAASKMFSGKPAELVAHFGVLDQEPIISLITSDAVLANMEKHTADAAGAALKANVKALEDCGFDIVLIDTAPSLGVSMAAALYSADFVMSPIELEAYSIQGIKKMVLAITNIRKANSKLQFLGMMPSKVDARNPRHSRHLNELRAAYPALMIPEQIGLRSSIADALASRIPVWKIRKTAARKAAQEVRGVANFVFDKICAADAGIAEKRSV